VIKNYIITFFRNFIRQGVYSFINIGGLAIGIAAFILLFIFIIHELSYDHFHEKADFTYRIVSNIERPDGSSMYVPTGLSNMAEEVPEQMPEIEFGTLLYHTGEVMVDYEGQLFFKNDLFHVDSNFCKIFSFKVLDGDIQKAVSTADNVVLTASVATKIFGNTSCVGKTFKMLEEYYVVGAILEDIPDNSHFRFDILTPFISKNNLTQFFNNHGFDFYIYYLTKENINEKVLYGKFTEITEKITRDRLLKSGMEGSFKIESKLQPLLNIHLNSNYYFEIGKQGKIETVYIFSLIAILILLIAIINFINLITTYGENRAKEVGIRKVVGANKLSLRLQFIGESILITFIALFLGVVIVELFVKDFGNIIDRNLNINYTFAFLSFTLLFGLLIGFLSSLYPSIYLTRFEPVKVLKGISKKGKNNRLKILSVIVQFGIAIFLISSVIIINSQLKYLHKKDLGFNKDNILVVEDITEDLRDKFDVIKEELLRISNIKFVAASQSSPGYGRNYQNAFKKGEDPETAILINENRVKSEYISTYNFEIIEGRDFDEHRASDSNAFILNETAVKQMGITNPIGQYINVWQNEGKIIGVIKDFHFFSFHTKIEPLVLSHYSNYFNKISIKIEGGNLSETIEKVGEILEKYDAEFFYNYEFVDQRFNQLYRDEEQLNKLIVYGSLLAIIISLLGLLALTTFIVIERTKEIGIRKALGGSVNALIYILLKDILKWVIYVNIASWPLAYWFMHNWLQNFAYRIEIKSWMFLIAGFITLLIAIITIISIIVKTTRANPIKALQYE
jgi:putative ABC transport system permease protein